MPVAHLDRRVPRPRTSAETRDLFRNVTESWTCPDGRLLTTPFGRQSRPHHLGPLPPVARDEPHDVPCNLGLPLRGSRTIERLVLQEEIMAVEDRHPSLRAENVRLKTQLITMIRMNEVMSRALRVELQAHPT